MVLEAADALKSYKVKLAAAFARIRIERRASGNNLEQRFQNILPEEVRTRETKAGTLRYRM